MLDTHSRHTIRRVATLLFLGSLGTIWFTLFKSQVYFPADRVVSVDYADCQDERSNIVFLKTHKCASTTLQNIFMRYGDIRNLTFVLPKKANYLGHPQPFHHSMVLRNDPSPFNILAHHTRFNRQEMQLLMPADTVYVTIVRDPVRQFESMYSYYDLNTFYDTTLEQLQQMEPRKAKELLNARYVGRIGRNQMSFDLGLDSKDFDEPERVSDFIDYLDISFHLVMLAERMEESLVLLKDLLCWNTEDVVTFRLNARTEHSKRTLSESLTNFVRSVNMADHTLYVHFQKKFDEAVQRFGASAMDSEITKLREATQWWRNRCFKTLPTVRSSNNSTFTYQLNNISDVDCRRMVEPELQYTSNLRRRQMEKG